MEKENMKYKLYTYTDSMIKNHLSRILAGRWWLLNILVKVKVQMELQTLQLFSSMQRFLHSGQIKWALHDENKFILFSSISPNL
jgi:hypothetical protein